MLNGNISNRVTPTLLLKINNTLIKKKTPTLKGLFSSKKERYELDLATFDFVMRTFLYTNYKIDLVMTHQEVPKYKDIFQEVLNTHQVPYGAIHFLDSYEISSLVNSGVFSCYIDDDINELLKVGHKHCYSVRDANNFVKRG